MKDDLLSWKTILASVAVAVILFGIYFHASRALYFTVEDLFSNAEIVKINVYGLVIPVGGIGLLIWLLCGLITAIRYKKQTSSVWSYKTQRTFNQIIGVFGVLGLLFAIESYQWLTTELNDRGYVYSEEESSLSAMGKHEVYIKP